VTKRKLVTNISKNSSLNGGHALLCTKVAKENFGLVGALDVRQGNPKEQCLTAIFHNLVAGI
jgi:hypothetical protein